MGPTAIGKTDFACELYQNYFQNLPLDIISVDSAMVYEQLNIGTGKPEQDILDTIPHALVDIRKLHQIYSVADFCTDARELIKVSHNKGRIPLLVGGTMMYFNALQKGMHELPSSNSVVRKQLQRKLESEGLASLYSELLLRDIETANRLEPTDSQRILRALEVYNLTGKPLSYFHNTSRKNEVDYNFINIILTANDRAYLHDRIKFRFYKMLEAGFEAEVEAIYEQSKIDSRIHVNLPGIKSCGYRQIWNYLEGSYNKDEMIEKSIISTRQLAKRQLTWLRSWDDAERFDIQQPNFKENIINYLIAFDFLEYIV